jgi:hypothetical protein
MSTDTKEAVHSIVRGLYRHPRKLFPSQQPQSIDHRSLEKIFAAPEAFVVSQKANGIHMTLVLGTFPDENRTRFCCVLDRTGAVFFYEVTCHPDYFKGTLLTGEVLPSKSHEKLFLVFDVVAVSGESFLANGYVDRMAAAQLIEAQVVAGNFAIKNIDFKPKPYYSLHEFLTKFEPVSDDDGLIFMPRDKPLTQTLPFKWKEHHTVDLLIEARHMSNGQWQWEIVQPLGIGRVTIDTSCPLIKTLEDFLQPSLLSFSVIMECLLKISPISETTAIPVKIRHDKATANLAATVLGTIVSINDSISREFLVSQFLAISL